MPFRLIQRTVLLDLIKITLLALFAVSAMLMLVGAMVEAARKGIDPLRVMSAMPYLIPPTLPYTIPSCLLFACTIVYGGMSGANEITALKAGGIHVLDVLAPALLLGIMLSATGVFLTDQFIPACNRKFKEMLLSDLQGNLYTYLKQTGEIYDPAFEYEVYVQCVREDKLIRPIIKRRTSQGCYDIIVQADWATLQVVQSEGNDGETLVRIYLVGGVATNGQGGQLRLPDRHLEMPVPGMIGGQDDKIETLTFRGCVARSSDYIAQARTIQDTLSHAGACSVLFGEPRSFAGQINLNVARYERFRRKSREARAELHLRLAQSTAVIPFMLLGCPISILFKRREFLQTFFVCFLPIVTLFYPMMILAFNIVKEGTAVVGLCMWAPTVIMCIVSCVFLRRVIRH